MNINKSTMKSKSMSKSKSKSSKSKSKSKSRWSKSKSSSSSSPSPLLVIFGLLSLVFFNIVLNTTTCFCQAQNQMQQNQNQQNQNQQNQNQNQQRKIQIQIQKQLQIYETSVKENPNDAGLRYMLGWFLLTVTDDASRAIRTLQTCFDPAIVKVPLNEYDTQYIKIYLASSIIGRYLNEERDYVTSNKFLKIAYDVSKNKINNDNSNSGSNSDSGNDNSGNDSGTSNSNSDSNSYPELCVQIQLSSQFNSFPLSNEHADLSLRSIEYYQNEILDFIIKQNNNNNGDDPLLLGTASSLTLTSASALTSTLNEEWLSKNVPGFANDPYVHCMYTLFPLSFYYRADVAKIAFNNYKIASYVWPELNYISPNVIIQYENDNENEKGNINENKPKNEVHVVDQKLCSSNSNNNSNNNNNRNKIRLGVISATISEGHSVSEDFGGILSNLNRSKFDVTYINVHEGSYSNPNTAAKFLFANIEDTLHHYFKYPNEQGSGSNFIKRIAADILHDHEPFDIILYLDLTMSTYIRRLGMMRLAPVQINTHGHPVTSGHPSSVIQYFISWAEAELPIEESQKHYTENLQLIPNGKIHQYYTPRVMKEDVGSTTQLRSRLDGMRFDNLLRKDFHELPLFIKESNELDTYVSNLNNNIDSDLNTDNNINLYVCMQKPFKVFPEFDELVCGILKKDLNGHVILHKETRSGYNHHKLTFVQRMINAGCDMKRIHFLDSQPNHKLLKLYSTANVVLDSYPAGGCTTTREALELGKAVITWPARLLGGRWTLGLYNIIGLESKIKKQLIASSTKEYIEMAVNIGTNHILRKEIELEIYNKTQTNLFYRNEAVDEWENILLNVSPVKLQCNNDTSYDNYNDDGEDGEDDEDGKDSDNYEDDDDGKDEL